MDNYESLLEVFADAGLDTPPDLTDAIRSLPWPGMLPSPWTTWTLIALVAYGERKTWAFEELQTRLAPLLGGWSDGTMALEEEVGRHPLPGLPEWECLLDGMYSLVIDRVTGEHIHLDLING